MLKIKDNVDLSILKRYGFEYDEWNKYYNFEFEELYVKYENDPTIRKSQVKASELFSQLLQERASTGRIYIQHVDHCNTHSAFDPTVAPVVQSNLCMEITIPSKPMKHIHDTDGEIALCTLAAFNLGAITSLDELEYLAVILVEALDALLDYQDYLLPAAEIGGKHRRALGIGVINLANYFAKNNIILLPLFSHTLADLAYLCFSTSISESI